MATTSQATEAAARDEPAEGAALRPRVGIAAAILLAALLMAVIDAVASAMLDPQPRALKVGVRLTAHLYDAGHLLALGGLAATVALVWHSFAWSRRIAGYLPLAVISLGVGMLVLPEDLSSFAFRVLGGGRVLTWALAAAVAMGVVVAAWIGTSLGRRAPWLGVALAVAALCGNHLILKNDYRAAHLYLAWAGAALASCSLAALPRPASWTSRRATVALAGATVLGLIAIVVAPSNAVLLQLLRVEGSVLAPYLARWRASEAAAEVEVPAPWQPWFRQRGDADTQPAGAPLLPADAIVLFITVDSLRADVLATGEHDSQLPTLAKLRDRSVRFTQARAPGSQTVTTLTQLFAGSYYSSLYWSQHPNMAARDRWPHQDPAARFPELLTAAGVATVAYVPAVWLLPDQGIVRGFSEQHFPKPDERRYAIAAEMLPQLRQRIEQHAGGPFFGYAHLLDAHYTVSLRGPEQPAFARYLANLAAADEQLGALTEFLHDSGRAERTLLIISADHGEAFGEHGTQHHRLTLYEELLHVPLLVAGAGLEPREVSQPVSLMDLGPTVLDLFGLPTPAHVVGQSLVPLLRGDELELTRPILAEGRLKKALYFEDGHKVIVDDRYHTAEVYDLVSDPDELDNLLLNDEKEHWHRVALLRRYFAAHTHRRPGYKVPYRP